MINQATRLQDAQDLTSIDRTVLCRLTGREPMAFQTPVTIEEILTGIHQKQYLLPAIQREFVWDSAQIHQLFDSLLRGYPIGSFLFWTVNAETARDYTFYNFLPDYHERDEPFASRATVPVGQGINAILDGQQRLTALNVGLYGSHAEKRKCAG